MSIKYPDTQLFLNGEWRDALAKESLEIINPATEEVIGKVSHARKEDLDIALNAAEKAFNSWKNVSAYERSKILRKAADIVRSKADEIATLMTLEQGKPLVEAKMETMGAADSIDWYAEEGRRAYGRIIPSRAPQGVYQFVFKEAVGVVAAFTPWNFPLNQVVKKVAAAFAAGCTAIVKGPEETPASVAELIKAFDEAGMPKGSINLVYGIPAEISEYLIAHPIVRKVTFTGSTAVGKLLASLAGTHMKRVTMELGGHSPAIVCEDADVKAAVKILSANKFRNAGQVCISPTRFLVHDSVYEEFVDGFVEQAEALNVGNGLDEGVKMGPLAHDRRLTAIEGFVSDAVENGAKVLTGGKRKGNKGYFFEPTVMTNVSNDARIMNEEPFGPLAPINSFSSIDEVIEEANRLNYGLAAYAYTNSAKTAQDLGQAIESGQVSINHHGLGLVDTPFGGVKDSGYGSEGGPEGLDAYMTTKLVSQTGL
ncbi:NAD-dependent succinate-semialdehyde dehydrogenase [Alphaproteobacteria bacterium]|jgi:succinate-semialdehyde dehydrogenase/glutarate-semialdehyde dehydrogenase|nr:NAD-dependent succinate-semialdehyde dehydrogenase [Alphaproteobacteria bacterium]MDB2479049.1 NAD-dependent succinate-semialdehyde dehydrogenase [Alphaproteobacteria bacterium]MDC1066602.1 NAD-dependent succinate-semialdehyde dehydrogenase [Alphaproteobacteria bacterium]MDC3410025.1 NAD-dependent succinate-semialdehyde dehydrogenase [Alphaproteobacteria bacterium]